MNESKKNKKKITGMKEKDKKKNKKERKIKKRIIRYEIS